MGNKLGSEIMLVERPEWVSFEFADLKGDVHKITVNDMVGRVQNIDKHE